MLRVCCKIAGMSEATNDSPSPRPITTGGPKRAAHELVWFVGGNRYERVDAANFFERGSKCAFQAKVRILAQMFFDQVRDDFGVGFGLKMMIVFLQFAFEFEVVFDDAVVDDTNASIAGTMRMRVLFGWASVRRPARMP